MGRKKRIICSGFCYHVMIRGVGGRNIFSDNKDRVQFCLMLQYASETYHFKIHGFCLMGNHVHLLVQPLANDLSSGMHNLSFRYAKYFNKKVDHLGYLFQGRFKAILVQDGRYLQQLIRYIHRNPVRAGIVANVTDYPWSSHQAYMGNAEFTWLNKDLIFSEFGESGNDRLTSFQTYVTLSDDKAKIELAEIRKSSQTGIYGSPLFIEHFRKIEEADLPLSPLPIDVEDEPIIPSEGLTLQSVINYIEENLHVSLDEMKSTIKKAPQVEARSLLVALARKLNIASNKELALLLQRTPSSIVKLGQNLQASPKLLEVSQAISGN